jgi:hypothetical protein
VISKFLIFQQFLMDATPKRGIEKPTKKIQRASWTPVGKSNMLPENLLRNLCLPPKNLPQTRPVLSDSETQKTLKNDCKSKKGLVWKLHGEMAHHAVKLTLLENRPPDRTANVLDAKSKETTSPNLPTLTTELEKELLSGIFEDWQKELNNKEKRDRALEMKNLQTVERFQDDSESVSDDSENWHCFRGGCWFR